MAAIEIQAYNIKAASSATGLSPSVLRIWESRFGWPIPKRKVNGYRIYQRHQIDDLRKVAMLVKTGMPISSIIVDGQPRWPLADLSAPSPRLLPQARSLPVSQHAQEAALQRDLISAFANQNAQGVKELLQRICWSVRPADEAKTAFVPTLVALAELRLANRRMPEEAAILGFVLDRCSQLQRMRRQSGSPLLVVPARACDQALASLAAVMLGFRGVQARPWSELEMPTQPFVTAGDAAGLTMLGKMPLGSITTLRSEAGLQSTCLAELLALETLLPWTVDSGADFSAAFLQTASHPG